MPTSDPYFSTDICVERLYNDYKKFGKLIIAVDFDDTVYDYHKKGFVYNEVVKLLHEAYIEGHHIVVFTGQAKENFNWIKQYMGEQGIPVTKINENVMPLPFGNDGKIFYNIFLDDRAGLGQAYSILNITMQRIKSARV